MPMPCPTTPPSSWTPTTRLPACAVPPEEGRRLRERGYEMIGVRIDSGDLAWLSREARTILDEAGFPEARIVASNELDEHLIASLKDQGAAIDFWGVGTKLVTAYDQPALGGVYKLSAIRTPGGEWEPRIKVSEQTAKVTTPGVLGVRRYFDEAGALAGDMIYDVNCPPGDEPQMIDPADPIRRKRFAPGQRAEELLVPVVRAGSASTSRLRSRPSQSGRRRSSRRSIPRSGASSTRTPTRSAWSAACTRTACA
jgi:nicotinate phosphoribosyltransferase